MSGSRLTSTALGVLALTCATTTAANEQGATANEESVAASPASTPVDDRMPQAGDRFRDCAECPEMVVLPAGTYRMGSPWHEKGRRKSEAPVHEVTIPRPFALGVHETTVAEFERFVDETGSSARSSCHHYDGGASEGRPDHGWRDPGFEQSGQHPVACVNWNDAQAYAAWLTQRTGAGYRLPSESEWEYAARAGTATARYWERASWASVMGAMLGLGLEPPGQCRHANGGDAAAKERYSAWTYPLASCSDGHVHTAPAGGFAPNGWGLHDMLGNVWEWTADCWNGSYAGAPSDGSAWGHSAWEYGDCNRVLRGGSWDNSPSILRAAKRIRHPPTSRHSNFGFRVARTFAR